MQDTVTHATLAELEAALDRIRESPSNDGVLELIVRRPDVGDREVLESAELDPALGLVGDSWPRRPSRHTLDGSPARWAQVNLMNARVIALLARVKERWPLAGDQLFIDFDLSEANAPPGTQLSIGSAVIEVSAQPHTGCGKFIERFGVDATKFVNSTLGRELRLRGINASVVKAGIVRVGDGVRKLAMPIS
jgi:hypothetical protein